MVLVTTRESETTLNVLVWSRARGRLQKKTTKEAIFRMCVSVVVLVATVVGSGGSGERGSLLFLSLV